MREHQIPNCRTVSKLCVVVAADNPGKLTRCQNGSWALHQISGEVRHHCSRILPCFHHYAQIIQKSSPAITKMSQAVEHKTKKRKHVSADGNVAEPSTKRSKTAKTKRDKDSNKAKEGKKKGKGIAPSDSQFKVVKATLALSIPPVFAMKPREGAEEMLDSMVMRFVCPCRLCRYIVVMY